MPLASAEKSGWRDSRHRRIKVAFRLDEDVGFLVARTQWAILRGILVQPGITCEQFRVLAGEIPRTRSSSAYD
jgi:hypothetical protein